jgi:hypothetical protein
MLVFQPQVGQTAIPPALPSRERRQKISPRIQPPQFETMNCESSASIAGLFSFYGLEGGISTSDIFWIDPLASGTSP